MKEFQSIWSVEKSAAMPDDGFWWKTSHDDLQIIFWQYFFPPRRDFWHFPPLLTASKKQSSAWISSRIKTANNALEQGQFISMRREREEPIKMHQNRFCFAPLDTTMSIKCTAYHLFQTSRIDFGDDFSVRNSSWELSTKTFWFKFLNCLTAHDRREIFQYKFY